MAESSPIHEPMAPQTLATGGPTLGSVWQRIKLVLNRGVFWSYERGSWQYDVIVAVILAFIFLTPRSWFHDQPQLELSDLRHRQGVIEVDTSKKDAQKYLIDSRLVDAMRPAPPEAAVTEILRLRLQREFHVKSVEPVRDKNGVLLGYEVVGAP
jgi:hypothetical protein